MTDETTTTRPETTPTTTTETISQTPQQFTEQVREERNRMEREQPTPTRTETANTVVHRSTNELFGTLQSGDFWKKALVIGGVAAAAFFGAKALKAGVDSMRGLGDSVRSAISETAGSTLRSVLAVGLGTTAAGAIYEAVQGKIPMQDVLREYQSGGATGLGTYLLGKVQDGVISIPRDAWDAIAGRLGLPEFSSISESVSAGMEWLDEHTHFSQLKERMVSWFNQHGGETPSWLPNLNLNRIASDMGISRENVSGWTRFGGMAGGSYLIYRWLKTHGAPASAVGQIGGAVGINAAVYLLLLQDGKQSFGREMMGDLGNEITGLKNNLVERLGGEHPEAVSYINEIFSAGSSAAGIMGTPISSLLDWAGRHPVEAMAVGNAMWFFRAKLMHGLKTLIVNGGSMARNNPIEAAWGAAAAVGLWYARGEVINRLIDYAYEDPQSADAASMRQYFQSLLGVDPEADPNLLQEQIPDFYKSLLEDPIAALRSPEVIENYETGEFSVSWDVSGRAWLLIKGFSAPVQMTKLTWEAFTTSVQHIFDPESEDGMFLPMAIAGTEMVVFGSMAWSGFQAQKQVFTANMQGYKNILNGMKSLVPGTKEWRFVWRSALETPFIPYMKLAANRDLKLVSNTMSEIRRLAQEVPPNYAEIQKITKKITADTTFTKNFGELQNGFGKSRFWSKHAAGMGKIKSSLEAIETAARQAVRASAGEVAPKLASIRQELAALDDEVPSALSRMRAGIERAKLLLEGNWREAFNLRGSAEIATAPTDPEGPPARPKFEADEMFRGKSMAQVQQELTSLEAKARSGVRLTDIEIERLDMLKYYMNPSAVAEGMGRRTVDFAMESSSLAPAERAARIDTLAKDIQMREKAVQSRFLQEIEDVKAWAKSQGKTLVDPAVTAKLNQIDKTITQPMAQAKAERMKLLHAEFKKLPGDLKTPQLKGQMRNALEAEGSFMFKLTKGVKGRMKMMGLMASMMFATDVMINANNPEKELSDIILGMGPQMSQLLLDVMPIAGTFSNFYSAFTGEELLTDNDVSDGWSRASNVVWGTVGAAGDILTVVTTVGTAGAGGAAAVPANIALRLTKAAKGGSKTAGALLKLWPKLQRIMEGMGGVRPFAEKVYKYIKVGANKIEQSKTAMKSLRNIQRVGTGVGMGLLAGGVANMAYGFVADVPEIDMSIYETA